jgi:hypothetical protein
MVEDDTQRNLCVDAVASARDELTGASGVATQCEEVVVVVDALYLQQFAPQRSEQAAKALRPGS